MKIEVFRKHHPNGQIVEEYTCLVLGGKGNRRWHGIQKEWYKNGNQRRLFAYMDGGYYGMYQLWNKNGSIRSLSQNKDGFSHGPQINIKYERRD